LPVELVTCNLHVSANSDFKFPYSKEKCKAEDAWEQGAEKTLDIRAERTQGGMKYTMNSYMICTPTK
jgi:hypothetical protein